MTTTPLDVLDSLHFDAPPINPTAYGLYSSTNWTEVGADEPSRFLNGVRIRPVGNYGGGSAFGVWGGPWCGDPDPGQKKQGERPDGLDVFEAMTVWAYDECDLTAPSRAEVQARAAQILRLEEQIAVERQFATRLLADAADLPGPLAQRPTLKQAIGYLEGEIARTNTAAFIHVGAQWASQEYGLFLKSGTRWVSPLGNVYVVGGGYVEGLANRIVATSQPFGWRDQPTVRTAIDERHNIFAAVAERSVALGYEALVAAVEITP